MLVYMRTHTHTHTRIAYYMCRKDYIKFANKLLLFRNTVRKIA